nr:hypothetical protein [Tanacetum cinerariifolium]
MLPVIRQNYEESPWQGFTAALVVLITGASQSRQHDVDYQSNERLCNLSFLDYLKLYFFEYEHVVLNLTHHGLDVAAIGKPACLGFRSCTSRSHYRSVSKQTTRNALGHISAVSHFGVLQQICIRLDDTWAWVAPGPERQSDATIGALVDVEGAHAKVEGVQAGSTPVHAPQPPPVAAQSRIMSHSIARDFFRFTVWAASSISQLLDFSGATYVGYFEMHVPYQRHRADRGPIMPAP